MKISLPYEHYTFIEIPDENLKDILGPPEINPPGDERKLLKDSLASPFGTGRLRELARNKKNISIIIDDITRPTPVHRIVPLVLEELAGAGVKKECISFIFALGTHRPMTKEEMELKLGKNIVSGYKVYNHDWRNRRELVYAGHALKNVPVWINRRVAGSDFIVGIGRIMPIDVCGYTGGGKIIIPGVCGEKTVDEMHWQRVYYNSDDIRGKRDNIVMEYIDSISRKVGLNFIVNVIMDDEKRILAAVSGDPVVAHKEGVKIAKKVHEVTTTEKSDIVVACSYPFDIEMWQANKALDNVGSLVKDGGAVVLIAPCYEGFSAVHESDIVKTGYISRKEIIDIVERGELRTKVVGVHLVQVAEVKDRSEIVLVTNNIRKELVEKVGLRYAETPNSGLELALSIVRKGKNVLFVNNAASTVFHVNPLPLSSE